MVVACSNKHRLYFWLPRAGLFLGQAISRKRQMKVKAILVAVKCWQKIQLLRAWKAWVPWVAARLAKVSMVHSMVMHWRYKMVFKCFVKWKGRTTQNSILRARLVAAQGAHMVELL
jgi:hypothetical protein